MKNTTMLPFLLAVSIGLTSPVYCQERTFNIRAFGATGRKALAVLYFTNL